MTGRELALSYLHTSERRAAFYERLGYRRAVIERPRLMVELAAARSSGDLATREAHAGEAEALDEIYADTYGRTTGAWARSPEFWRRRIEGIPKLWSRVLQFAVADRGGSPVAYVAYEQVEGAGTVHELGCAVGAEAEAVALAENLLVRWREAGVLVAEVGVSSGHPLRPRLNHLVSEDRTAWDEVFVRAQDERQLVKHLTPVLMARAGEMGVPLRLASSASGVVLRGGNGESEALTLAPTELALLAYNGRPASTERALGKRQKTRGWGELFPETGAARCGLDGY
jgi:hypothetical protein